ncbi:MAG TPA: hypothetical protein VFQ53_36845 [Kofleriaceae bacterium]|nr:hypothetical protein [Kofleriaceae bacterium]
MTRSLLALVLLAACNGSVQVDTAPPPSPPAPTAPPSGPSETRPATNATGNDQLPAERRVEQQTQSDREVLARHDPKDTSKRGRGHDKDKDSDKDKDKDADAPNLPPPPWEEPAPPTSEPSRGDKHVKTKLDVIKGPLCVTKGAAQLGRKVVDPTMRAVALGTRGDAAAMSFTFQGDSESVRALASGQKRRQLGLKLRAENGCNLVYVMWRLDPKPFVEVSIKVNPGKRTHEECGAGGYTKIKKAETSPPPSLVVGKTYALAAEIVGDELAVMIDDQVVWRGTLPDSARSLSGPAGIRSDNVQFDLLGFSAPTGGSAAAKPKCIASEGD